MYNVKVVNILNMLCFSVRVSENFQKKREEKRMKKILSLDRKENTIQLLAPYVLWLSRIQPGWYQCRSSFLTSQTIQTQRNTEFLSHMFQLETLQSRLNKTNTIFKFLKLSSFWVKLILLNVKTKYHNLSCMSYKSINYETHMV